MAESWVTYARPFAKRRRIYRLKRERFDINGDELQEIQWQRFDCAIEAIGWMWTDFKNKFL